MEPSQDNKTAENDHEEFEVESIVDHRWVLGHLEYLIKWKGLFESENTWTEESKVTNKEAIASYITKKSRITHAQALQAANDNSDSENSIPEEKKAMVLPPVPNVQVAQTQQPVYPQAMIIPYEFHHININIKNDQLVCFGITKSNQSIPISPDYARVYYPVLFQKAVSLYLNKK